MSILVQIADSLLPHPLLVYSINPNTVDGKSGDAQIYKFRLSDNCKRLAAIGFPMSGGRFRLNVWDLTTEKMIVNRPIEEAFGYDFSPDGKSVAVRNNLGLAIQDLVTGKDRAVLSGNLGYFLCYSPDRKVLAIIASPPSFEGSKDNVNGVILVEVSTGKTLSLIKTDPLGQFAFSLDGQMLATAHIDAIRIFEISTGKELFQIRLPENFHGVEFDSFAKCLSFTPNGRALATGLVDGTILIWDLTPWEQLPKKLPRDLDQKALACLWSDMGDDEAPKAYRAIWTLADSPAQTLPFLKVHLKPAVEPDSKQVQRLLADLDSDQFTTRDKAAKELTKLGEPIEPALRKALEGQPSEEVQRQVKAILDAPRAVPTGETLRTLRAIQILERIGTQESVEILKKLASGAAAARETLEAQESLDRLAREAK
jgi:hypothetical protein